MKITLSLATLIALIALQPAVGQDTKPSEESVRQLIEAMHTGESFKDAFMHMGDMLRASTKDMNGRTLNAEQEVERDSAARIRAAADAPQPPPQSPAPQPPQ